MNLTRAALASLLPRVRDLRITRVAHLTNARVVLGLEWAGGNATVTMDIVELLASRDATPPPIAAPERLSRAAREAPRELSEADVRRRGLPLWWSGEWLEAQLAERGTFRAVAESVGVSEQVISEWGRRHGISRRPRVPRREAERIIAGLASDLAAGRAWPSLVEQASEHGVSTATVSRWRAAAKQRVEAL